MRKGLRLVIEEEPTFSVIDEVDDGLIAFERIKRRTPDIAVLDINMPKMGGFDLTRKLQELRIPVDIIFLTMYKDRQMFEEAMQLGAKGYVLKNSAPLDIVECIKAVSRGGNYISAALSSFLVEHHRKLNTLIEKAPSLSDLTPAEIRILKLISESKSTKEIATKLSISYRTVENHRANISTKLQLHGSYALLKFALEHSVQLAAMVTEE